jgi:hypothetical protein
MPFGFQIAPDTPPSGTRATGARSALAVSGFRLRARLGFSIPPCFPGQRGITPAFGYGAPHPSAEGTSTPLTHTLPSTHYAPVRLPFGPQSRGDRVEARASPSWVSPDYSHRLSNVPCPLPRRTQRVHLSIPFPVGAAFPGNPAGRRSRLDFRGLLRLHSRYGPLDRSTAQSGLCHEAPARPVARQDRSSATRPIDNCLGGTFLHWRCAPSGRTDNGGARPPASPSDAPIHFAFRGRCG